MIFRTATPFFEQLLLSSRPFKASFANEIFYFEEFALATIGCGGIKFHPPEVLLPTISRATSLSDQRKSGAQYNIVCGAGKYLLKRKLSLDAGKLGSAIFWTEM